MRSSSAAGGEPGMVVAPVSIGAPGEANAFPSRAASGVRGRD
jgi:hypothetical protein